MKEQEKFENWLSREKEKGLLHIKFYPINTNNAEKEHIYEELNSMNLAIEEKKFVQIFDL